MFQQRERHLFGYTASKTHNKGNTKRSKNIRVDVGILLRLPLWFLLNDLPNLK